MSVRRTSGGKGDIHEWHGLKAQPLAKKPVTAERRKVGAWAPVAGILEISATGEVGYAIAGRGGVLVSLLAATVCSLSPCHSGHSCY
jgi:hypothetical protein